MSTDATRTPRTSRAAPAWMAWVLRAAAIYNVLWGAWAILFPAHFWSLVGMEQPNYPFLWQCIGMIVGVYGVGYWIAAGDPARHWPIVLVGLLGKILGPIGFLDAWLLRDMVPARFGLTILTNDLAWWIPFTLILAHAYRVSTREREERLNAHAISGGEAPSTLARAEAALQPSHAHDGASLAEHSRRGPVLLVFLRHMGCTFCREALADLSRERERLERAGVSIALVHMSDDASARAMFEKYGLTKALRVSDPSRELYRAFNLPRGTLAQLFGMRMVLRGFVAGVLQGHGVGALRGDGFQMPGAFVLRDGRVTRAYRHEDAADRPDYCALSNA